MKSVLITGSSNGFGKSIALELFNMGYNLIVHGRDRQALEEMNLHPNIEMVVGDLRNQRTIDELYIAAKEKNLDVLINNAGVYDTGLQETLETNLVAPIELTERIYPLLKKKGGLVLFINSLAGLTGNYSESNYCTSKYGLRGFSKSLREQANKDGVIVTDVFLGAMNTQMTKGRKDPSKCIDPREASKIIANLCETYKSVKVDEIILTRRGY